MQTVFPSDSPTFGDRVRIRPSPEIESKGLASLIGQVYGQTTPSEIGVEVIGELTSDYAINVFFDDRNESSWFAPALVEFIDHGAGTEVTIERSGFAPRQVTGGKNLAKRKPRNHGGAFGTDRNVMTRLRVALLLISSASHVDHSK